jgi:hypothetical protein
MDAKACVSGPYEQLLLDEKEEVFLFLGRDLFSG